MWERNIDVWEIHQLVASCMPPNGDPACNSGMCPDWEIEPVTLWFPDQHSIHWATPARAQLNMNFLKAQFLILFTERAQKRCTHSVHRSWSPSITASRRKQLSRGADYRTGGGKVQVRATSCNAAKRAAPSAWWIRQKDKGASQSKQWLIDYNTINK